MSGVPAFAAVSDAEFDELLRLQRFYFREATKCQSAKAYLPGCIMLGSALEAALMAMVHCFAEEVASCKGVPTYKSSIKPLLVWKLSELLRVAKTLQWLPADLEPGEDWSGRRARIGDHAEVVRLLRNLVHPSSYIAEHASKRITAKHLAHAFEVLELARQHLLHRLTASLKQELASENGA